MSRNERATPSSPSGRRSPSGQQPIGGEPPFSVALRIGLSAGRLIAGVVGSSRFSYDLWGDTVNLASRLETMSPPGGIHVSQTVAEAAGDAFIFARHGTSEVKGLGPIATCLLVGRKSP